MNRMIGFSIYDIPKKKFDKVIQALQNQGWKEGCPYETFWQFHKGLWDIRIYFF